MKKILFAATMVVAGVYLVARLYPVYAYSGEAVLQVVLYVGALSALLAALIALAMVSVPTPGRTRSIAVSIHSRALV